MSSNFRSISLKNVIGKIFTRILNQRLLAWVDVFAIFTDSQCAYRKRYSIIDNTCSLMGLARKKGRFYCRYIDFTGAFDSVQHNILWYIVLQHGIGGNCFKIFAEYVFSVTNQCFYK